MTNLKIIACLSGQLLLSTLAGAFTAYAFIQLIPSEKKYSTDEIQSIIQQRKQIHGNTQTESPEERADCTVYQTHNCSI